MMKTIFTDTQNAFEPFFDTPVFVKGRRPDERNEIKLVSGTFYACVFDQGFANPILDADADTDVKTYTIQIRAGDWLNKLPPQIGDEVQIGKQMECAPNAPSSKLVISQVGELVGDVWDLQAKEVFE